MPSRAMIQTGRFLTSWENCGETLPANQPLLGECLKEQGYQTCGIGKWHNGFESYARSFNAGGQIFFGGMWDHWNVPVNNYDPSGQYDSWKNFTYDPFSTNRLVKMPAEKVTLGKHSTDLFVDEMIDYLKHRRAKDQPFYLYGSFLAPHDPRTMPEKFRGEYDPAQLTLPPNLLPQHPFGFDILGERDETLEAYPRTPEAIRQHLADYYAMIGHLDARLGDLLAVLREENLLADTLIIFTGDNGLALGQHGLMGKQNLYDHSIRVPLIMSGPNIPKNKRIQGKVLLLDLLPTILAYVEAPLPADLFGQSLLPMLVDQASGREEIYLMFTTKIRGLVTKEYKYLEYRSQDGHYRQLFDRQKDPYEQVNLVHDPQKQAIVQDLQQGLLTHAQASGDRTFSQGEIFWQALEKKVK